MHSASTIMTHFDPSDFPENGVSEAMARVIVAIAVKAIAAYLIGGIAVGTLIAWLKWLKAGIQLSGQEEALCEALEEYVADTSNPLDDKILEWIQEQWEAL